MSDDEGMPDMVDENTDWRVSLVGVPPDPKHRYARTAGQDTVPQPFENEYQPIHGDPPILLFDEMKRRTAGQDTDRTLS